MSFVSKAAGPRKASTVPIISSRRLLHEMEESADLLTAGLIGSTPKDETVGRWIHVCEVFAA